MLFSQDVTATIESFKETLCLDNHSATIFAFSRVSSVLKLLDVTINRVSLGLHFINISEIWLGQYWIHIRYQELYKNFSTLC